jgi:ABC-type phosphate transport system permease subunit
MSNDFKFSERPFIADWHKDKMKNFSQTGNNKGPKWSWLLYILDAIMIIVFIWSAIVIIHYRWTHIDQTSLRNWLNMWQWEIAVMVSVIYISLRTKFWFKQ